MVVEEPVPQRKSNCISAVELFRHSIRHEVVWVRPNAPSDMIEATGSAQSCVIFSGRCRRNTSSVTGVLRALSGQVEGTVFTYVSVGVREFLQCLGPL